MPRYIMPLLVACIWGGSLCAETRPLGMSALGNCGTDLADTTDCPECSGEVTFEVDRYWHGLEQCLRDVRDSWKKYGADQVLDLPGMPTLADFTRDQILAEMGRDAVQVRHGMDDKLASFADSFGADLQPKGDLTGVVLTNDLGQPYNGMGQTGLGYFLYQLAAQSAKGGYDRAKADTAFYRTLARGTIATVLAPVDQGGLATQQPCATAPDLTCTWYHSITRHDRPSDAGGTLNQMLHVLRDLGLISALSGKLGWDEPFDLNKAIMEGLNQLFLSGGYQGPETAPDLADFKSDGRDSTGPTWAYYGFNTQAEKAKGGYFLKNLEKNCSYHAHDVQLLGVILKRARAEGIAAEALKAAQADGSALTGFRAMLRDAADGTTLPPEIVCNDTTQRKIKKLLKQDSN